MAVSVRKNRESGVVCHRALLFLMVQLVRVIFKGHKFSLIISFPDFLKPCQSRQNWKSALCKNLVIHHMMRDFVTCLSECCAAVWYFSSDIKLHNWCRRVPVVHGRAWIVWCDYLNVKCDYFFADTFPIRPDGGTLEPFAVLLDQQASEYKHPFQFNISVIYKHSRWLLLNMLSFTKSCNYHYPWR